MDILRPQIIQIGGRCYRRNPVELGRTEGFEEEEYTHTDYNVYCDEVCDDAGLVEIEETDKGYRLAMDIPSAYFKYIIGKKGETKKRLENDTRTQILIPKQGQEGDVVILGRDRGGVFSSKSRIDILVESARQRQPFTHFLSFPITGHEIQKQVLKFKEDVLRSCDGDRGIDQTIFQNPKKLHLTLGTLALLSNTEIKKAQEVLNECMNDIIKPLVSKKPISVQVKSLEYMNDDPGEVDVLYIQVQDPSDRLQELSDRLVNKFMSEGLMQRDYDRVKLHVTVMNTLFRKDPSGAGVMTADKHSTRESFDATNILRLHRDYNFGQYDINTLHLSQRYSTGADGYYGYASKIELT